MNPSLSIFYQLFVLFPEDTSIVLMAFYGHQGLSIVLGHDGKSIWKDQESLLSLSFRYRISGEC